MGGVALHRLHDVRDQVVAAPELRVDVRPGVLDQVLLRDEPVVRDHARDREHDDDPQHHPEGFHVGSLSFAFRSEPEAYPLGYRELTTAGICSRNALAVPNRLDHLRRRHPPAGAQEPVPDDLEHVPVRMLQQPPHHPRIAERRGEPLVGTLHGEPAIELLGLELDVTEREGVRQPREDVLLADLQRRAPGVDRGEHAVEPRVGLGRVPFGVGGLVVVPVVERAELQPLPLAPQDVLDPSAISSLQQRERLPERVERIVDREVQAVSERERTELLLAFELALVLVVGDRRDDDGEDEEEQQTDRRLPRASVSAAAGGGPSDPGDQPS